MSIVSAPTAGTQDVRQLELLAATANDLLTHTNATDFFQILFDRLSNYCGLEVCFSYWVAGDRLRLGFYSGVSEDVARSIEWLEYGQAVCGTVARDHRRISAEDIQSSQDPLTSLVRSFGVTAYCCHPLIARGTLLGTLSFGTRTRPRFTDAEVMTMHAVSDQAAAALERFFFIRELERQNAELTRANQDLQRLTYAATHDLQEPVRTINTYAELLTRALGADLAGREREILSVIGHNATRLRGLMTGLLDFHRFGAEAERRHIDPNEALGDALVACRSLIAETGTEVSAEMLPRPVYADALQLSCVFQNLLSNAIKYRARGRAARVRIAGRVEGSHVLVSTKDNGEGIAPEYQDRIFDLFRRLHGADVPGSGLGLSICRRIVERHGGTIWVQSEPGEGSTFFFTMPAGSC